MAYNPNSPLGVSENLDWSNAPAAGSGHGGGAGWGEIGFGIGLGTSIAGVFNAARQAALQEQFANSQAKLIEFNAEMSLKQIDDIKAAADLTTRKVGLKASQIQGSQRAAAAAQGIGIDTGSAAELQKETQVLSDEDILNIRVNATKQAFGVKANAMAMQMQANMVRAGGSNQASATLMTGGLQLATNSLQNYSNYMEYRYKSAGGRVDKGSVE